MRKDAKSSEVSCAEIIAKLRRLCGAGKRLFGCAFLDEAEFYMESQRLRLVLGSTRKAAPASTRGGDVLRAIDELEQFVEDSQTHIFGKVAITENEFLLRLQNLENALHAQLGAAYGASPARDDSAPFEEKSPFENR